MEEFWFQSSWNVMKRRRRWICTYGEVLNYIGVTHDTYVLKGIKYGWKGLQYIIEQYVHTTVCFRSHSVTFVCNIDPSTLPA